jgi:4,5-DOPA dioxygenase extradiol
MERKNFLKLIGLSTIGLSMTSLADLNRISHGFSKTPKMPVLFVGHGSPMNAIEENQFVKGWRDMIKGIPTPKAILCVSAHWETRGTKVTAMDNPKTIHDFGGFAPALYQLQYPAAGDPQTADTTLKLLEDAGWPATLDANRGLDHGAWVPLKIMYPDADIPVLQLSMPTSDPGKLIELGKRLRPLRDEGVLIVGSGFMTHGLPFIRDWSIDANAPGWSSDFDQWAADAISRGDVDMLASYKDLAPAVNYAHPTVEHFTPLFVTLGAATVADAIPETLIEGFWMGLSKRSLLVA